MLYTPHSILAVLHIKCAINFEMYFDFIVITLRKQQYLKGHQFACIQLPYCSDYTDKPYGNAVTTLHVIKMLPLE